MIIAEIDRKENDTMMYKTIYIYIFIIVSHSLKDAKDHLYIITQISRDVCVKINNEKSSVMIFNL